MNDIQGQSPRRGAVAVVLRDGRFLVIRRARRVAAGGTLCFPGGGIEPGETEAEALQREIHEELAVSVRPLLRLWESTTDWQVHIAWWHAELSADSNPVPNPAEVAEVHWLTAVEMLDRSDLLTSNRRFLEAMAAGVFAIEG